jgi:hypothetical protein
MTTAAVLLSCAIALSPPSPKDRQPFEEKVSGTLVSFRMLPVPDGEFKGKKIKNLFVGESEVTWDLFDIWAFRFDLSSEQIAKNFEVESRPSRPYGAADRGFGHQGFAALGMTPHAADLFCQWLSRKTGKKYRLPTEEEWEYAARAGAKEAPTPLADYAWYWENSDDVGHAVKSRKANAWGLYDVLGNMAEWAIGPENKPMVCGGSWRDKQPAVSFTARQVQIPKWNENDPQNPKSKWWLANAPFVGFRVVCEG